MPPQGTHEFLTMAMAGWKVPGMAIAVVLPRSQATWVLVSFERSSARSAECAATTRRGRTTGRLLPATGWLLGRAHSSRALPRTPRTGATSACQPEGWGFEPLLRSQFPKQRTDPPSKLFRRHTSPPVSPRIGGEILFLSRSEFTNRRTIMAKSEDFVVSLRPPA